MTDSHRDRAAAEKELTEILANYTEAVDPARLDELAEYLDPEDIDELIALFLEGAPEKLTQIRRAIEDGDRETLRVAAHTLKSNCGNVGASRMQAVCALIEAAAQSGAETYVSHLVDALEENYHTARQFFEHAAK